MGLVFSFREELLCTNFLVLFGRWSGIRLLCCLFVRDLNFDLGLQNLFWELEFRCDTVTGIWSVVGGRWCEWTVFLICPDVGLRLGYRMCYHNANILTACVVDLGTKIDILSKGNATTVMSV